MKFTTPLLVAAALLASSAQACIRLHVNTGYVPLLTTDSGMTVQIWDNGDYYDTHWQFSFSNGHYVELWDNGKQGFVSLPGGYRANLNLRQKQCEINCYEFNDTGCKMRGSAYESALDDGFGNCNEYGHQLCNYSDCNGWHEKGWSEGDDGICKPSF
ncbi:hypothetical protein KVT40_002614 [Elsinoe batatas]|uniref:Uncharacterized protein n=1 Tax=Elsinoe batatas TaxID=2601811 RepID=A0A8K0L5B0_9PEZI|nr:hypothetical protein KVT40_002614 [Elsinoe batatas]